MISLTHPSLLGLAALPVVLLAMRHAWRRRYWGHAAGAIWSDPRVRASSWRYAPDALLTLAMAALAVALADPRVERTARSTDTEGRAIVMVVDLSFTMQDRVGPPPPGRRDFAFFFGEGDPRPTRLDVLKDAMKDFVASRERDRIGLVVFSERGYVISPLTEDHAYLAHYIDMIDSETLAGEGYTAIGEGVAAATVLLDFQGVNRGREGVVLVFTDGENNFGRDPIEALRRMHEAGHRGYLIGIDLPDYVVRQAETRALVAAFDATGGRYYEAESGSELDEALGDVGSLETASLRLLTRSEEESVYRGFVIVCLSFMGLSIVLRAFPALVSAS